MLRLRVLACLSAATLGVRASAVPVIIASPVTVNPGDTTIVDQQTGNPVPLANAEILVAGTTLTMNGQFSIVSLSLQPWSTTPGVLTYSTGAGLNLTALSYIEIRGPVSGDTTGASASRISADGLGYGSGQGPGTPAVLTATNAYGGGAGYGGAGSSGQAGPSPSTGTGYGSYTSPSDIGSGGGESRYSGITRPGTGGAGGGSIRLTVAGHHNKACDHHPFTPYTVC